MKLENNDLIAWAGNYLAIGQMGQYWDDADVLLLGGATAWRVWEENPDKRATLDDEGFLLLS